MAGAVVVIVLAGLVLPISMLLVAVIIDVISVIWVASVLGHDQWTRMKHVGTGVMRRIHLLPVRHARAH